MEPVIWVEVMSRHRDVLSRHRIAAGELRVGRAYDNDVVVDDPHVAPVHLRIARDAAGGLVAEDLGSLNGLFVNGGRQRHTHVALDGEDTIRIGQTWLRIRDAAHPVPPERLVTVERRRWPLAVLLGIAVFGIEILGVWLGETAEPKFAPYLEAVLNVAKYAVVWIAVWTVISRVFAGAARFEQHLVLALAALLAYSLYDEVTSLIAFGVSWPGILASRYVIYWLVVGAAALGHMRIIGPNRMRLKFAGAAAVAAAGIVINLIGESDARANVDQPPAVHRFYPPSFQLGSTRTEDGFLDRLKAMEPELQRARRDDGQ
jgi:hypothetical protein